MWFWISSLGSSARYSSCARCFQQAFHVGNTPIAAFIKLRIWLGSPSISQRADHQAPRPTDRDRAEVGPGIHHSLQSGFPLLLSKATEYVLKAATSVIFTENHGLGRPLLWGMFACLHGPFSSSSSCHVSRRTAGPRCT